MTPMEYRQMKRQLFYATTEHTRKIYWVVGKIRNE
jgi:hypothetical protein